MQQPEQLESVTKIVIACLFLDVVVCWYVRVKNRNITKTHTAEYPPGTYYDMAYKRPTILYMLEKQGLL